MPIAMLSFLNKNLTFLYFAEKSECLTISFSKESFN